MTMERRLAFPAWTVSSMEVEISPLVRALSRAAPTEEGREYVALILGEVERGGDVTPSEMVRALRQALGYWLAIETRQLEKERLEAERRMREEEAASPHVAARHLVMADDEDEEERDEEERK